MMRKVAGVTGLFLALCIVYAGAPQSSTATVGGMVFDSEGKRPIARAAIELQNESGEVLYVATTREDGRFSIPSVRIRQYKLIATRNGYVAADLGGRARGGRNVTVTATPTDISIAMIRTVSVSGRITDRVGQPLVRVNVEVLRLSQDAGRRLLTAVASARTNDLGEYRIYWLPPGRYYVRATPVATSFSMGISDTTNPNVPEKSGRGADTFSQLYRGDSPLPAAAGTFGRRSSETEALVPVYLPGTIHEGEAISVDLKPGEDYRGADIIVVPTRWYKIKGFVTDGLTQLPAQQSRITRVPIPSGGFYFTDEVEPSDGRFEISALPGRYALFAYTTTLASRIEIEVKDRDIENLAITINPPTTLPARIVIDGRPAPGGPEMGSFRVHLGAVPDMPGFVQINGKPDAAGTLVLPYVQPGTYHIAVEPFEGIPSQGDSRTGSRRPAALVGRDGSRDGPLPPLANSPNRPYSALAPLSVSLSSAYVKRMRFGDEDLPNGELHFDVQAREEQTRTPRTLEIVIGTDGGSVQGTVRNAPNTNVLLVPNEPLRSRFDLFKTALTDASGRFRISAVAPGDYKVFALNYVEANAWFNPEFIKRYEDQGSVVHVNANFVSTIDPSLIP
jgi:hypothetical protein